jgi:hypothetical protein
MSIGTLQERSLHAALKAWYVQPGDQVEQQVEGYWIDIVRGDLLIEVQTRHFAQIRPKLIALLEAHPMRLLYPIFQEKWIVRMAADGAIALSRRKSPKRGRVEEVFGELVSFPELALHPHLAIEVVFVRAEEVWRDDGRGSWRRRRWSVQDQRLLAVTGSVTLATADDFRALLPCDLASPFSARELAEAARLPLRLAQKMAYCLRRMGLIAPVGKRGRAWVYQGT